MLRREDRHRNRGGRPVVGRRGLPPRVPLQEPVGLPVPDAPPALVEPTTAVANYRVLLLFVYHTERRVNGAEEKAEGVWGHRRSQDNLRGMQRMRERVIQTWQTKKRRRFGASSELSTWYRLLDVLVIVRLLDHPPWPLRYIPREARRRFLEDKHDALELQAELVVDFHAIYTLRSTWELRFFSPAL